MLRNDSTPKLPAMDPFAEGVPVRVVVPATLRVRRPIVIAALAGLLFVVVAVSTHIHVEGEIRRHVDERIRAVRDIRVPNPSEETAVLASVQELLRNTEGGIRDAQEAYSGFRGFVARCGKRLKDFGGGLATADLSAVVGALNPNTPTVDAEKIVEQIMGGGR